jgi:hypothetical protein
MPAAKKKEDDEPQDVSAYIGTDPVYMNYSDERSQPFRAEVDPKADDDTKAEHETMVAVEDRAYEIQGQQREGAGLDPKTGVQLDLDPEAEFKAKRDSYKSDSGWAPAIPSAMTGQPSAPVSNETDEEFAARVAKANEMNASNDDPGDKGIGRGQDGPVVPPSAPPAPDNK